MSEERNKLRIHAQLTPQDASEAPEAAAKTVRWRSIPHPKQRSKRTPERLTLSDRLLRNSAIACALLLGILAVGNIDRPWAHSASESVERALTMHIDLDESIGGLSFVRKFMPEGALVFLNLSGQSEFAQPVEGDVVHTFSDAQPWLLFSCPTDSDILAIADGTITAVSELSGGTIGLLIDHGSGRESVYAYLAEASVKPGQTVQRGDVIGRSSENVYFELREDETPVDPSERMGL